MWVASDACCYDMVLLIVGLTPMRKVPNLGALMPVLFRMGARSPGFYFPCVVLIKF